MQFHVSSQYEKADFITFCKAHMRVKTKTLRIIQIICAVVLALMELALIVLSVWSGKLSSSVLVLLVVTPLFIAEVVFLPRIQARTLAKTYEKLGTREMLFLDDVVQIRDSKSRGEYDYDAFDSFYHTKGMYLLYINRQQALVLPERSFTEGDPAAFAAFLCEKTGLSLQELD